MKRVAPAILLVVIAALLMSCGGGNSTVSTSTPTTSATTTVKKGTVYITGSDAPLPSVLAFQVTVNSLKLFNGTTSVEMLSEPATIEFSRLLGLRTLIALNSVDAGTYTGAIVTLASPVISYLDLTTTPAGTATMNGTLSSNTVTVTFANALTVGADGLAGLHFHLNLRASLAVDGSGQLTGGVNPKIGIRPIAIDDDDAQVDELRGGLVSTDVAGNSFVIQRANGRNLTIRVNSATQYDGTSGLAAMSTPAVVEISGKAQADGSILADHVELHTSDKAFLSGVLLDVAPAADPTSLTLLVRDEIPAIAGVPVGMPATVKLGTPVRFDIYRFGLPVEAFLFNSSQLVRGQRIAIGGPLDSGNTVTARRVLLHRQGLDGALNPGSLVIQSPKVGSFQLVANGFFGYLFGAPVKVMTGDTTKFINVGGLAGLTNATTIRVVGLLLKDGSGNPVLVAGSVSADPEAH
jgi:hypothetical protein